MTTAIVAHTGLELADLWPPGEDLFARIRRLQGEGVGRGSAAGAPAAGGFAVAGGGDRGDPLAAWGKAFGGGDRTALLRRLAWDGIEPAAAAAALSDPCAGAAVAGTEVQELLAAVSRAARRASRRPLRPVRPAGGAHPKQGSSGVQPLTVSAGMPSPTVGAQAQSAPVGGRAQPAAESAAAQAAAISWQELWRPWLTAIAGQVTPGGGRPPGWSAGAWNDAGGLLLRRLAGISAPAVAALYAAARRRDLSPGAADRWGRRVLASGLVDLYRDAPVLLRRSVGLARDWAAALAELCSRLDADRPALAATFAAHLAERYDENGGLGDVTALAALGADPHHGGRQALRLDLAAGVSVAYKPRSLALEHGVERLSAWMARAGCAAAPAAPRTLAREGYGWQEWLEPGELQGVEERQRYFARAGAWICVAYALRAQDLHAENVVATRRGPQVVDCEMFLQPEELRHGAAAPGGDATAAGGVGAGGGDGIAAFAGDRAGAQAGLGSGSCLRSGLVTDPLRRPAAWMTTPGGFEPPRAAEGASAAGWEGAIPANLPRWHGARLGIENEADAGAVSAGFSEAYRCLLAGRAELLAPAGPLAALRGAQVRVLFRSSQHYAEALQLLAAPRYQRGGTAPSLLLEGLVGMFATAAERPAVWPLAAEERVALERLDLPRFTVGAADRVLVTSSGDLVSGLCATSGYDATVERLHALSEADLARQLELLHGALRHAADARAGRWTTPAGSPIDEALRLGRYLRDEPVGGTAAAGRGSVRGIAALSAADIGAVALQAGAAGRALFLAALAAVADRADLAPAARLALAPVLDLADKVDGNCFAPAAPAPVRAPAPVAGVGGSVPAVPAPALAPAAVAGDGGFAQVMPAPSLGRPCGPPLRPALGGMTGLGSLVWTLTWCARLLGDPALLVPAARFAACIDAAALAAASSCDVHDGVAGALLGLLALHEESPDPALLARAVACGDHLAAAAAGGAGAGAPAVQLAGFAHGAAGMARALAALAAATGETRFAAAAIALLDGERRLFDAVRGDWALLYREGEGGAAGGRLRRAWRMAWCHGAPGGGLARAMVRASLDRLADAGAATGAGGGASPGGSTAAETAAAEAAAKATAAAPAAAVDHLCCGNLGRAATLAAMGETLGRADWQAAGERLAAAALAVARARGGWVLGGDEAGRPGGEWSLLRGLSGIGYQLLVTAAGRGALPCALALELPSEARRRAAIGAAAAATAAGGTAARSATAMAAPAGAAAAGGNPAGDLTARAAPAGVAAATGPPPTAAAGRGRQAAAMGAGR